MDQSVLSTAKKTIRWDKNLQGYKSFAIPKAAFCLCFLILFSIILLVCIEQILRPSTVKGIKSKQNVRHSVAVQLDFNFGNSLIYAQVAEVAQLPVMDKQPAPRTCCNMEVHCMRSTQGPMGSLCSRYSKLTLLAPYTLPTYLINNNDQNHYVHIYAYIFHTFLM